MPELGLMTGARVAHSSARVICEGAGRELGGEHGSCAELNRNFDSLNPNVTLTMRSPNHGPDPDYDHRNRSATKPSIWSTRGRHRAD